MFPLNLSTRLTHLPVILLVLSVLVVQGCFHSNSGGGGSTGPTNTAPVFMSGMGISVVDVGTTVTGYTTIATDADGDTVTFSLSGGMDQAAFSIDSDSGVLSFNTVPDFDNPTDNDTNNSYVVDIIATDGMDSVAQTVTVTVVEDANPVGYYDVSGTASVGDGSGGMLTITDLQGLVNSTRFIAISDANGLVYDGTITDINANDFTATVSVFQNGALVTTASVSGMITVGAKITGTLTGSGLGSGTFELTYALSNNTVATLSRVQNSDIEEGWFDRVGGGVAIGLAFAVDELGSIRHGFTATDGVFNQCVVDSGTISPVLDTSLYTLSLTLSSCNNAAVNGDYSGLASMRTESIETPVGDRLVLVVSNLNFGIQGEFKITNSL